MVVEGGTVGWLGVKFERLVREKCKRKDAYKGRDVDRCQQREMKSERGRSTLWPKAECCPYEQ